MAPMWSSWPCVRTTASMSSQAVLDDPEVGEDQVDARLLGLREQDAAVDDQQPAVELEHGHVAADLAEPAQRHHPQTTRGQRWRRLQVEVRLGDLPRHSGTPPRGEVDAQLGDLLGGGIDQRGPDRAAGQPEDLERCLDHHRALTAVHHSGVDRQQALVDRARLHQVTGLDGRDQLRQPWPHEVTDHAHHAHRTERQQREVQHVLAAVVGEVGAGEGPGDVTEVALGVLHRDDPRVLGEPDEGLHLDRHTERAGMS